MPLSAFLSYPLSFLALDWVERGLYTMFPCGNDVTRFTTTLFLLILVCLLLSCVYLCVQPSIAYSWRFSFCFIFNLVMLGLFKQAIFTLLLTTMVWSWQVTSQTSGVPSAITLFVWYSTESWIISYLFGCSLLPFPWFCGSRLWAFLEGESGSRYFYGVFGLSYFFILIKVIFRPF